jgi:putative transposase
MIRGYEAHGGGERRCGRPRETDMRAAMNAILYLLRTGCPWRYLPRDGFPPRSTVYNIFHKFQREGTWGAI